MKQILRIWTAWSKRTIMETYKTPLPDGLYVNDSVAVDYEVLELEQNNVEKLKIQLQQRTKHQRERRPMVKDDTSKGADGRPGVPEQEQEGLPVLRGRGARGGETGTGERRGDAIGVQNPRVRGRVY